MVYVCTVGLPYTVYVYVSIRCRPTSRPPPDVRANGHMSGKVSWLKLCDGCDSLRNVKASTTSRKEKMKQVSFWPWAFVHPVVMALVAAIMGQLTLITILSVSKRNGPQPRPSHIKPLTFGSKLRPYDMISRLSCGLSCRLLGRGSMHVLSTQQFQQLRNHGSVSASGRLGSLLDIGAGDGRVTKQLQPLFSEVFATEMSSTMRWRLKRAGFT